VLPPSRFTILPNTAGLLYRAGCDAHAAPGARAPRRPRAREARGAGGRASRSIPTCPRRSPQRRRSSPRASR
jgi:hypothetical protein